MNKHEANRYKLVLITGGSTEDRNGYAREHYKDYKITEDYHLLIKRQLDEGRIPQAEAAAYLDAIKDNTVITTAEIGCGVVPMDAFSRRYREENGRVNCILAERADEVILMICGIARRIK